MDGAFEVIISIRDANNALLLLMITACGMTRYLARRALGPATYVVCLFQALLKGGIFGTKFALLVGLDEAGGSGGAETVAAG